jgi:hypothetical protein
MFAMKKFVFLFAILCGALISVAQKQVINDANAEARKLTGSFNTIKVSNGIDLYISQGETESIAVSASNTEYRNKIKISVESGVLKIWYEDESKFWKNGSNRKLKAYISFKNLTKLTAGGASDVILNGDIRSDELTLSFSGASDFKGGAVFANELVVNISGASDVDINGGKVTTLKVDASGASDFSGFGLITDNCSADASGASDIKVTVNNELNARASGASGIHYKGSGKIQNLKTSGASSVNRRS